MTARDHLDLARLRREPAPVWPWVLLIAAVCLLAAAAVVPHAAPIAQVVDAGGEE